MSRKKGTPKTGGRQKGTPNKITTTTRQKVADLVAQEIEHLGTYLESMKDNERRDILRFLMPFALPKQGHLEIETDTRSITITPTLYLPHAAESETLTDDDEGDTITTV